MEQVYLASCTEYQYESLKQAVDDIFDHLQLNRFLFQGANVIIKPNLLMKCNPDTAIITHPLLVAAVGTKVKELGGKVTIAESSGGRYTLSTVKHIYQSCGYTNMAQQYGFLLNTDCSYRSLKAPKAVRCKEFQVISPILDADIIIDVGKLKTHCMTGMSGAVKNMFGVVPGLMKPELHCRFPDKQEFSEMLVDLCEAVRPHIAIMDAVMGMEGNGPSGGKPRFIGTMVGGINPYAVDMVCASIISLKPSEIFMLRSAMERGLCPNSVEEIEILGASLTETVISDFLPPQSKSSDFIQYLPSFLRPLAAKIATPVPKIRTNKCIGCGKCAESCPQHTIEIKNKKAYIIYNNCIRCYCCHEMCPEHIIDIKRLALFNL